MYVRLWKWTRTECVPCTIKYSKFNLVREHQNAVEAVCCCYFWCVSVSRPFCCQLCVCVCVHVFVENINDYLHKFGASLIHWTTGYFWKFNWYDCVRIIYKQLRPHACNKSSPNMRLNCYNAATARRQRHHYIILHYRLWTGVLLDAKATDLIDRTTKAASKRTNGRMRQKKESEKQRENSFQILTLRQ